MKPLSGPMRKMLVAISPEHWFGGKGAWHMTMQTLRALARRGLMEVSHDPERGEVYRLNQAGIEEWKKYQPRKGGSGQ